ncbi:MAG: hypothetical protein NC313_03275 [Butyrivibrio sp.]|nr:hypothetical protein [Butyrivibrio sp.]
MMKQKENVMLGTSTNLILGFDPNWQPGKMGSNGLFSNSDKPLKEIEIDIPYAEEKGYEWSYPMITIHDDIESLLGKIFPFRFSTPSDGTEEIKVNMGALLIGDVDREDSVKKLSETLGVKLCKEYGYVLVRTERISGESKHPVCKGDIILHPNPKHTNEELGICESFRSDLIKIRKSTDKENGFNPSLFTVEKAQICLNFYKKYGTHFVSQAICGDAIFQVFAYEQENYERIKSIYRKNDFTNERSLNFMPYITDANTGAYGYVKEYGNILCYSGDSQLTQDLEAGKWLDKQWSERDSIFTPFLWNSPINRFELNSNYSKNLPLYYTLTPLSIFAEYGRRLALKRVMKGAMIQKFGTAVKPYFSKYFPYDKATLPFCNDIQGFVSNFATRKINAYKPTLNFDELQFVASQNTESFTLVSNLMSASSPRHIFPGEEVMLVFQNADFESDDFVTVVELEQKAYENCVISCKDFYGGLQIVSKNRNQHITVVDGICYVTENKKDSVRQMVAANSDIRQKYETVDLQRLRNSIIYSYTFANSVLSSRTYENSIGSAYRFAREAMLWLSEMIPNGCDDMELMDIRILALDDIRMSQNANHIAYVPILPPEKYSRHCENIINYIDEIQHQIDCYQQKIEQRKTQELIVDVGKALNENIIESGKLLSEFIQANAKQQKDLAQYYEAVISVKNSEMKQLNKKTDLLELELNKQKAQMENAVIAYKETVDVWKTKAEIKFGLDVATTLFSTVTSIFVPASTISAVKDLGLVVQRIQKLLNILNNIHKLYTVTEPSVSALKKAETALNDLDDCDFDVTHSSSWDECSIQLNYILNMGPDITEKRALLKEFSLLMLKGKNYMSAKSSAVQLSRDIYNQQRMEVYNVKQQERLDALSHDLELENLQSLDHVSVDLAGLTGDLIFLRSQMFAMLSKAFLLYDQSLQYKNLQPATHITSFDLMSFKGAIAMQSYNTTEAETKLAALQVSRTRGIDVKVKVPVSQLTNGNSYVLSIMPDNFKFSEYVDVRIRSVIAKIDGVAEADNNKYFVRLNYPGNTFSNRDIDNNLIMFRTNARERIYEYNADSGMPNFTDEGESWSENVSAVTPFSEWEISLPEKRNSGLKFADIMADITLTFVLDVRIVNKVMMLRSVNELPAVDTLIGQMAGNTVLNGWDVVFNMSLQKIQDVLDKQYEKLKQNTSYGGNIDFEAKYEITSTVTGMQKFKLKYGYPKLSFLTDDPINVKVEIPILSGTVQNGVKTSTGKSWDDPVNVDEGAYILAYLPLGKAAGMVNDSESENILSVIIDFAKGSFVAKNMKVINNNNAEFSKALEEYFAKKPVNFIINSLNMNRMSVLDDLKPSEFLFKTLITAQGTQILQLFIMTNCRKNLNYSLANLNYVSEPIPMGSECSLFISSERFFKNIMPQSFKKSGWSMEGLNPRNNLKSWSGEISHGSLTAAVDLSKLNRTENTSAGNTVVTYQYTYYVNGGCVTLDIIGMKLEPDNRKVKVSFSKANTQSFVEKCETIIVPFATKTSEVRNTLNSDYNLEIKADIPLTISGSERNQKISMTMENKDCQITGHLSGGGPCGCGDDIQAEFNQQLRQQIPSKVKENLNIDFDEISLFAIKNLLFVDDNYITFDDVAIPGDVVITGTFNK